MDNAKLNDTVREAEGLRLFPYDDNGRITVGYGHNLSANGISSVIAEWLLHDDLLAAQNGLQVAWPTLDRLDDVRQRAFVELAFNLGIHGLLTFSKMLHAAAAGDFTTASQELLNSKAATQEAGRIRRIASMIASGEDVDA